MALALIIALAADFAKRLPQTTNPPQLTSPAVHDRADLEMQHAGGKHIQVQSPASASGTTDGEVGAE